MAYSDEDLVKMSSALDGAVTIIGPNLDGNVPGPLYNFMRRFAPTFCTDVVLVPDLKEPSVILAQRNMKAVAPGQYWIFGGRVDKKLKWEEVAQAKVKAESSLEVHISPSDIIGIGRTYFDPDPKEEKLRNHAIATPNLCFAKRIDAGTLDNLMADSAHTSWHKFTSLDATWHPYIVNAVANAWDMTHPKNQSWKNQIRDDYKLREILSDTYAFTPLRFSPLVI